MMTSLTDTPKHVVLITGAAKRIGAAMAEHMALQGWHVALHYHHAEKEAKQLQKHLHAQGAKIALFQADLTDKSAVEALIPRVKAHWGTSVSCLINNAAIFDNDQFGTMTHESFARHWQLMVEAPMFLMQAMQQHCDLAVEGNIINILDYCVLKLPDRFLSYTVSKSALWTATQMAARALAPYIRVNAIGPGPTLPSAKQSPEQFEQSLTHTPLKRATTLEEICHTLDYLLATPSMTGQLLLLDGGRHIADEPYC
jgi:NAD(P)-dependent dehydrogenase (short-subunit alcohol dehydrogenase family)